MIVFRDAGTGVVVDGGALYMSGCVRIGDLSEVNPLLADAERRARIARGGFDPEALFELSGEYEMNPLMQDARRRVREAAEADVRNARMRGVEL